MKSVISVLLPLIGEKILQLVKLMLLSWLGCVNLLLFMYCYSIYEYFESAFIFIISCLCKLKLK